VLKVKPYKIQKAHYLTDKMKQVRFERSKALLRRVASRRWETVVFSDEKVFTIEQSLNKQNDRIWMASLPSSNSSFQMAARSQKPASLMVWAAITSNGKSPLHFVKPGVKIDQVYYREHILEGALLPWAKQHFGNRSWTLQQDSAPSHRAKMTQKWCRKNLPDFIDAEQWPPNSPDLNPLDFSVWSILETKVCVKCHKSLESLKRSLIAAWNEISNDVLRRICKKFPERLKAVVKQKGGYIEN
jgi:inhibitor of nuclear factor kappa-B kinase subunit alpha